MLFLEPLGFEKLKSLCLTLNGLSMLGYLVFDACEEAFSEAYMLACECLNNFV